MTKLETLLLLNQKLLQEMPRYQEHSNQFPEQEKEQRRLLRCLMNVRPPRPLDAQFLKLQDQYLQAEVAEKGVTSLCNLRPIKKNPQLYLWQGDITTLSVEAIVNAANSALLGCFVPCHGCIDNAIHSVAGLQLRNECHAIMSKQGHEEETGKAKITESYNLPCKKVIHTVGPIIDGELCPKDCDLLASCYEESLKLAVEANLESIAFCCISTGEFHFPNDSAAQIAVETVTRFLRENQREIKVIFNVFKDTDYQRYRTLLGEDC